MDSLVCELGCKFLFNLRLGGTILLEVTNEFPRFLNRALSCEVRHQFKKDINLIYAFTYLLNRFIAMQIPINIIPITPISKRAFCEWARLSPIVNLCYFLSP